MINPDTTQIEFCEGCPAQNTFVGEPTENAVAIRVFVANNGRVYNLGDQGTIPGDEFASVEIKFVDIDGGESKAVSPSVAFEELNQAGMHLELRKTGPVAERKTIEKTMKAAATEATSDLVSRIGRCTHAALNEFGRPDCPAMAWKVARLLVNQKIAANVPETAAID